MTPVDVLADIVRGASVFLLIITVLVAVHELGHYLAARACGMHVEAFAVMMGGIRKTDLGPLLSRPMLPAKAVWAIGYIGLALAVIGLLAHSPWVMGAGLVVSGLMIPVWVSLRLERLYHLKKFTAARWLGQCALVALAMLLFGARGQFGEPLQVVGLLSAAAWVATAIVYYQPVLQKADGTPQGHGRIEAEGQEVPVYFRPVWSATNREGTEFALLALPLGGFAAIRGMHPKVDGSEVTIEGGFYNKPPWMRLIVLFAGPFFSVVFGVLLLTGLYMSIGKQEPDPSSKVGGVAPSGQAELAGIKKGDLILSIDGVETPTFYEVVVNVRDRLADTGLGTVGLPALIEVEREGRSLTLMVVPQVDAEPMAVIGPNMEPTDEKRIQARLGMGPDRIHVPYSFSMALAEAAMTPVDMVKNLAGMVVKPQTVADNLGGPASIAVQTTAASRLGLEGVLLMAGLLSISLGVLNLLPIVPLDGGQMVVATVELFRRGKRLSWQIQQTLGAVGFLFMIALFLGASVLDIGRFFTK
ncbi:MAG: site-2 protease family protein [Fimbriimonadaceae bacterium]|nr:site-2 protease family protein [Fimbriimonadaceae bacterium]QYK59234.1 MAG: site-2 protease family protein [Fimbriimonadaceae bacterium]